MRGVQGLGAAIVLPAALSIVMNMFSEGAERNKALGLWGGIGAGGATVGLLAGGPLTRYAGWQYIFYLNVPIGAAALLLARAGRAGKQAEAAPPPLRPARRRHRDRRPVAPGLRDLARAAGRVAAPDAVALLAVSAALLVAFLVIETRAEAPLLPLRLFRLQDPRRVQRRRLPARRQLLRASSSSAPCTCSRCSATRR